MTEDAILRKLPKKHPNLVLGIGDDCAIFRPRSNEELVFTTDLFIEDVHFRRRDPPQDVGRRALTRSLSDIAAMAATPRLCLVSLAVPSWAGATWIDLFYRGLMKLAQQTKTALAGGDLSHARQLTCDVMICGSLPRGKALRRDGARPGDWIYVSGPLGGWRHKRIPEARLDLAKRMRAKATSCIDISDGLALDLHRICLASGVSAAIENVPLLDRATLDQALHDGEDYELLYTAPPRVRVPGLRIGTIQKGKPGKVMMDGKEIPPIGYDHFRNRT